MAGQNDFLIFDENQDNMLTQENYAIDSDRTDGFQTGLARSNVTNKVLHQTSMMCHAIGECIKDINESASDSSSVSDLKEAIKNALKGDFSRNIGEITISTIPLTDAGLHLLDGALIQGGGAYNAFVTYIAGLRTDYPDLFTTEALWQQSVSTYGVCGKFVYDSVNNTVRLPKITGIVEGTTDVSALGDLVEAGLPNITGAIDGSSQPTSNEVLGETPSGIAITGAFRGIFGNQSALGEAGSNYSQLRGFSFNASLSSSIYGNSSTVQPQSIKVLYYIVVATSVKTNIEVDIDQIATDLNGKAGLADNNTFTGINTFNNTVFGQPSSQNNSFLTTVAHDFSQSDKYMKLGNGILIQWGYKEGINSSGVTVTLPQAFSDAYYTILLGRGNYSPGLAENPYWADRTTTNFKLYCGRSESRNSFWLAIGTY